MQSGFFLSSLLCLFPDCSGGSFRVLNGARYWPRTGMFCNVAVTAPFFSSVICSILFKYLNYFKFQQQNRLRNWDRLCGIPVPFLSGLPAVLRIRIYYYADPDPGSKKCPYGSGS